MSGKWTTGEEILSAGVRPFELVNAIKTGGLQPYRPNSGHRIIDQESLRIRNDKRRGSKAANLSPVKRAIQLLSQAQTPPQYEPAPFGTWVEDFSVFPNGPREKVERLLRQMGGWLFLTDTVWEAFPELRPPTPTPEPGPEQVAPDPTPAPVSMDDPCPGPMASPYPTGSAGNAKQVGQEPGQDREADNPIIAQIDALLIKGHLGRVDKRALKFRRELEQGKSAKEAARAAYPKDYFENTSADTLKKQYDRDRNRSKDLLLAAKAKGRTKAKKTHK